MDVEAGPRLGVEMPSREAGQRLHCPPDATPTKDVNPDEEEGALRQLFDLFGSFLFGFGWSCCCWSLVVICIPVFMHRREHAEVEAEAAGAACLKIAPCMISRFVLWDKLLRVEVQGATLSFCQWCPRMHVFKCISMHISVCCVVRVVAMLDDMGASFLRYAFRSKRQPPFSLLT